MDYDCTHLIETTPSGYRVHYERLPSSVLRAGDRVGLRMAGPEAMEIYRIRKGRTTILATCAMPGARRALEQRALTGTGSSDVLLDDFTAGDFTK